MLITMGISIYTSRLVLRALGVDDYGVYNIVAGMVTLISFLNSSMSGATSRFLTYAQGKNDFNLLKQTFGTSMTIHVAIAIIVVIVLETLGLWFLNHYIEMPHDARYQAFWVFQSSVVITFLSISRVPFVASIISHEQMNAYAYIEIINSCLNLVIALSLTHFLNNRLMIYAGLNMSAAIVIFITYLIYSAHKFGECRCGLVMDKKLMKPMFSFFGWDIYGNLSVMARGQGVNVLINMFFGVIGNAAFGIAAQVQSAVGAFSSNIVTAVKPQIIKSYASDDINNMIRLILTSSKFIFILLMMIGLPLIIEMRFILQLWLGEVPTYSVGFSQLNILFVFFSSLSFVTVTGVHATGNIKRPSFINGTIYLSVIPLTYILYKFHGTIYIPFILNVIFIITGCLINLSTLHRHIPSLSVRKFIFSVLLPCIGVMILSSSVLSVIHSTISNDWIRLIIIFISSILITPVLSYFIIATKEEHGVINKLIIQFLHRK